MRITRVHLAVLLVYLQWTIWSDLRLRAAGVRCRYWSKDLRPVFQLPVGVRAFWTPAGGTIESSPFAMVATYAPTNLIGCSVRENRGELNWRRFMQIAQAMSQAFRRELLERIALVEQDIPVGDRESLFVVGPIQTQARNAPDLSVIEARFKFAGAAGAVSRDLSA